MTPALPSRCCSRAAPEAVSYSRGTSCFWAALRLRRPGSAGRCSASCSSIAVTSVGQAAGLLAAEHALGEALLGRLHDLPLAVRELVGAGHLGPEHGPRQQHV